MRIYRVVYEGSFGEQQVGKLWTSYTSAVTSAAQVHNDTVRVEVADVPDDLWQPADKAFEARKKKLVSLWHQLAHTNPFFAKQLATDLVERADRIAAAAVPKVLPAAARTEAEELMAALPVKQR